MTLDYGFTGNEDDLLVVTDAQFDFTYGVLGTTQAIRILPAMRRFIQNFRGKKVWTKDTHQNDYLDTQEGRLLPVPHTIFMTKGWRIDPSLAALVREDTPVFEKDIFGSMALYEYIRSNHFKRVFLIGFCTGICVISNAVLARTADPELEVHVIGNLCACVNAKTHKTALDAMKTLQMYIDEIDLPVPDYHIAETDGMAWVTAQKTPDSNLDLEEAYIAAERDGIRLIRVTELPVNTPLGMKHGGWPDTYANRKALEKYA